jgi:hypothetical protein
MKIELKLTADEIIYCESKTNLTLGMCPNDVGRDKWPAMSIMLDVGDKVMSKAKQLNRKQSLFDSKKKHKISFKFHEAHTLHDYLSAFTEKETDPYKQNLARNIITQLNQKLA